MIHIATSNSEICSYRVRADGNPVTSEGIKQRKAKSFLLGTGYVGFPSKQNRAGIVVRLQF